jgi:hypothetical protein
MEVDDDSLGIGVLDIPASKFDAFVGLNFYLF